MSKVIANQILTRQPKIIFEKSIKKDQVIVGGYFLSVNTRSKPTKSWKNNECTIHSSRVYIESYGTKEEAEADMGRLFPGQKKGRTILINIMLKIP